MGREVIGPRRSDNIASMESLASRGTATRSTVADEFWATVAFQNWADRRRWRSRATESEY